MCVVPAELEHLPEPMTDFFLEWGPKLVLAAHELLLFGFLLSCYLLGPLQRKLPSATAKHVFSILFGFAIGFIVHGPSFIHCVLVPLVGYFLTAAGVSPVIVLGWSLGYISLGHLYRAYFHYMGYRLDFKMALMVSAVKTMIFSYSYADGQLLKKNPRHSFSPVERINKDIVYRALDHLPSLVEFWSYAFFCNSIIFGPCFEIKHYLKSIDGTLYTAVYNLDIVLQVW